MRTLLARGSKAGPRSVLVFVPLAVALALPAVAGAGTSSHQRHAPAPAAVGPGPTRAVVRPAPVHRIASPRRAPKLHARRAHATTAPAAIPSGLDLLLGRISRPG